MDAALKAKWVEALRSGEYRQGKLYLHNPEDNSFCCLGVLCVVHGDPVESLSKKATTKLKWRSHGLSDEVCSHLGNKMNDNEGKTFSQIADYIEREL